jgi:hypothetical protein
LTENGSETKVSEAVVTLLMPIALRERLQALARANERSMSAEARVALRAHLGVPNGKVRPSA